MYKLVLMMKRKQNCLKYQHNIAKIQASVERSELNSIKKILFFYSSQKTSTDNIRTAKSNI